MLDSHLVAGSQCPCYLLHDSLPYLHQSLHEAGNREGGLQGRRGASVCGSVQVRREETRKETRKQSKQRSGRKMKHQRKTRRQRSKSETRQGIRGHTAKTGQTRSDAARNRSGLEDRPSRHISSCYTGHCLHFMSDHVQVEVRRLPSH